MEKLFKCPFCNLKYKSKDALLDHMDREHQDELHGLPPLQVYFNYRNKYALNKGFGKSVLSGKPTPFNLTTGRYERFADDAERKAYREIFKKNMIKAYGKETLLNDPEHQKKMLAGRSISGKYTWSDYKTTTEYTGSYEKKFLEHLDLDLGWSNPSDIMMPAPQIIPYVDIDGKKHFHIPDVYIQSLNLIINIKSSENKHYRLRDIETELIEDKTIRKSNYNYIKIMDNDFSVFDEFVEKSREQNEESLSKN